MCLYKYPGVKVINSFNFKKRLHALANGSAAESSGSRGAFVAVDGIVYHQSITSSALQLVVSAVSQHATAAARHNAPTSGHLGINKTVGALTLGCYWSTIQRDAERYIRICDTCQRQKATRYFRYGM